MWLYEETRGFGKGAEWVFEIKLLLPLPTRVSKSDEISLISKTLRGAIGVFESYFDLIFLSASYLSMYRNKGTACSGGRDTQTKSQLTPLSMILCFVKSARPLSTCKMV